MSDDFCLSYAKISTDSLSFVIFTTGRGGFQLSISLQRSADECQCVKIITQQKQIAPAG